MMMASRISICVLALALIPQSVAAKEWADKMFKVRTHDFGTVARGAKSEYRFEFKNLYKKDVHISRVRASCGCVSPSIETPTLKSLESGTILVKFNTKSFRGKRRATITATITKPYYAEVQLVITGYIRSDVMFDPPTANFGTVDQGTSGNASIKLSYSGRSSWKINEVNSSNPHIEVVANETSRKNGRIGYEFDVRLKEDAPAGFIQDELTIVTSDKKLKTLSFRVEGHVMAPLSVSPQSLFLGLLKPGQKVTKTMIVRGKKPFKVTAVECDDKCFEFKIDDSAKPLHVIPVVFTAGEKSGKVSQSIQVKTDGGLTAQCLATAVVKNDE